MNADIPPYWNVYISVTDADATLATAEHNGATIAVPAFDVLDVGRMGIIQDPGGAFISVWQPRGHIGAGIVNEPGSFVWSELSTPDIARAKEFYETTFGWGLDSEFTRHDTAGFTVDGAIVCGAHTAGDGEFPSWSVWFDVDDCDATAAAVVELGGSILMPPDDMDFGRGALVAAPDGAVFGIGNITDAV